MQPVIPIYVEVVGRRAFAGAIEWPGWCRGGRSEEAAMEALLATGGRYAAVARRAGIAFALPDGLGQFHVVERLTGNAGTEYGVPSLPPSADERPVDDAELARLESLLRAAWETFADAADRAAGVPLRLGPRGGGRDLAKIEEHVRMSEEAYLSQLGARRPSGAGPIAGAPADATADESEGAQSAASPRGLVLSQLRLVILTTLESRVHDRPIENPSGTRKRWLPRYLVRRASWHVLDHAWEIEDRMAPTGE